MMLDDKKNHVVNNVEEPDSYWDSVAEQWFEEVKEILIKRKHIILLVSLILMVFPIATILMSREWRMFLFTTDENRFQWVGITAAAAGIGICINAIQARKKFKADLVSKSRIDWIAQTKPVLSEFMVLSSKSMLSLIDIKLLEIEYINGDPETEENEREFDKYKREVDSYNQLNEQLQRARRHIIMSFSDADDNETMVTKITAIDEVREGFMQFLANCTNDPDEFDEIVANKVLDGNTRHMNMLIEELMEESRNYFKQEWDRAKRGE